MRVARLLARARPLLYASTTPDPRPRWRGPGTLLIGFALIGIACQLTGTSYDARTASPTPTPTEAAAQAEPEQIEDAPVEEPAITGPGVEAVAFPDRWNYTAVKTANLIPAPSFLGVAPIGSVLPWNIDMSGICDGDDCTFTSVIRPFIPESTIGEIPRATWVVDGPHWTLDVRWPSTQSTFGEETVCVVENHWLYELTVTEAEISSGRAIASAVIGTWTIEAKLDLGASSGDVSFCGAYWDYAEAWSVVAKDRGPWGDVAAAEALGPPQPLNARRGTGTLTNLVTDDSSLPGEFTTNATVMIDRVLGTMTMTLDEGTAFAGTSHGPIYRLEGEDGEEDYAFMSVGVGPDSSQMYAGFIEPILPEGTSQESINLQDVDLLLLFWGLSVTPGFERIPLYTSEFSLDAHDPITQMLMYSYHNNLRSGESDPVFEIEPFFEDLLNNVLARALGDYSEEGQEPIFYPTWFIAREDWLVDDGEVDYSLIQIRGDILAGF